MIKSIAVYKGITDMEEFIKHLHENICSRFLQFPGVIGMNITKVQEMDSKVPQDFQGMQIIIETYFESPQVVDNVFHTKQGAEILQQIHNVPSGSMSVFFGEEYKLFPPKKQS